MKYLLLPLIIILASCSLDNNSAYWNVDPMSKSLENKKLSKILKKSVDFKTMTFDEFNIFLKDYSIKTDYPDIND
tara:strand:+ start:153 stop:377 length:225 start_codon:yes stop_codon:yes gene_type:complete